MTTSLVDANYRRISEHRVSTGIGGGGADRRPSLREMPSFRDEASKALDRRSDLQKIKDRLSFNREILHGSDPASKPWLRKPATVPVRTSPQREQRSTTRDSMEQLYSVHTAAPANISEEDEEEEEEEAHEKMRVNRPRNLSRGTSASADSSEGSFYADVSGHYDY